MNLDHALQTFIVEGRELIAEMELSLLAVDSSEDKSDLVNAIFRAAHTIKGSAGLFGLDHIVAFTHVVESVLDRVRDSRLTMSDDLIHLMLSSGDHIGLMLNLIAAGEIEADPELSQSGVVLLDQLHAYLDDGSARSADAFPVAHDDIDKTERIGSVHAGNDHWHISVRFGQDILRNGMDPISFIRYLATVGTISAIITLPNAIPEEQDMDAEACYLGFEIALHSDADKQTIENVFEFVRDESQIRILSPHSQIEKYIELLAELPEESTRLGELLVRCGSLTAQELDRALNTQSETSPAKPIGSILVDQRTVRPEVVEAALQKQNQVNERANENKSQESQSIRVDAEKLDQLINLVGELIIAGASVNLIARRTHHAELLERASTLSTLVEEVRDSALQLRMVKIGATFNRFKRVVHDVSRELGKDIVLEIEGEETELDKTVVEKIGDPLMHLIRNAMDHGIEAAQVRLAQGKAASGTIRLNAYHDSGSIVISVSDDGGGLNRDRIHAKAVERGLIEAHQHLSDDEVYALIFEPGFSTAEQVSNLSGRGVGMDVVKRNITALRGSVSIHSETGTGTTVSVRLPLTLAIIDGFLVEIGNAVFAIPLDMIEECVEFTAEPGHDYTNLRGEVLPFIRLRELFSVSGNVTRRENIVVLKHAGRKAGLVVDTLLGEFQTVIKPLAKMFSQVKCISGSTILGSGEVALILDVPALVEYCETRESTNSNYRNQQSMAVTS